MINRTIREKWCAASYRMIKLVYQKTRQGQWICNVIKIVSKVLSGLFAFIPKWHQLAESQKRRTRPTKSPRNCSPNPNNRLDWLLLIDIDFWLFPIQHVSALTAKHHFVVQGSWGWYPLAFCVLHSVSNVANALVHRRFGYHEYSVLGQFPIQISVH